MSDNPLDDPNNQLGYDINGVGDPEEWEALADRVHAPETEDEYWDRMNGWHDDRERAERSRLPK